MTTTCSFATLLELHLDLAELFARHQEALLDCDLELARRTLRTFRALLLKHIDEEERVLMPVYKSLAGATGQLGAGLLHGDHRKLTALVAELEQKLEALDEKQPQLKRKVLAMLDEERTLKHVLEHHDQRERRMFFPVLDRLTTEPARRQLLAQCTLRAGS